MLSHPLYRTFKALALSATVLHISANKTRPTSAQKTFVLIFGTLAAIYLINPTLGVFEFLPDNIPFLGNVDDATATIVLISALTFFGIKVPMFFSPNKLLLQPHPKNPVLNLIHLMSRKGR